LAERELAKIGVFGIVGGVEPSGSEFEFAATMGPVPENGGERVDRPQQACAPAIFLMVAIGSQYGSRGQSGGGK